MREPTVSQNEAQQDLPTTTFADFLFASLLSSVTRRSKAAEERVKILRNLRQRGLLDELEASLVGYDSSLRLFLSRRVKLLEVFIKVARAIPKEWREDKWLWRELMRVSGFAPEFHHLADKSLRHLRRQARKIANLVSDDDPNLSRAILEAYATGVLKLGDKLPSVRADGVEKEVSEMLAKLAAYYAAGHLWVLARLREMLDRLEEHWKALRSL
ncbi:hypothetical protein Q2T83_03840 [Fervidibacter sacchari]|uniref:CHAD domain-containing protein n=1 Tax=Candidatus Fervidibacter sacchari TaxID=1448929 RepID=A0ABT2EPB7_9BACT|nr:hypothetical protein [Candidatus Fervidibacter sacchari]MCS3919801.1 hypothetical protein [Candidatus Fervidibacter sacchari]WKU16958.1 hypothetical protein Q2T83_03840 [Candidatus Fervidibacter sacchari]